jgi:zinc transport system permease protein
MIDMLKYEFLRNALIAAVLVSFACGMVGTYVVIKRIVFISGGISHAAFGGIGLGYFLGINPIVAAIPFSIACALGIGAIAKRVRVSEDAAIGILWTVGMALGIIFINLSPGYAPDLFSYLFGNILTVPNYELVVILLLDVAILFCVLLFYREFLAICFDEDYAAVIGVPTGWLYFVLLSLVALSVVVLIKIVGIILVLALLTIPSAICKQFTFNIKKLMALSTACSMASTLMGLWISYALDIASGATIVLLLGFAFLVASAIRGGVQ